MDRRVGKALLAVAILPFFAGCPLPLRTTLELAVKDYQTPKTVLSFPSGSGVAPTTPIVVSFSATIDTSTLAVGGSMAPESDGGTWSVTTLPNDTLTFRPKTSWSTGSGKTLTVDCANGEGYAVKQVALTYGVLDGVVYVHGTNGNDDNPGTIDLPKKTIQKAIDTAGAVYSSAAVHVAAGTYQPSSVIILKDGISLYGGYDATDWTKREDPDWAINGSSLYPTVIQVSPNVETILLDNTSRPLTIDGFSIKGDFSGNNTTGIYCANCTGVTLQSNSIDGGGGDNSYGLTLNLSSITVQRNAISGGKNGNTVAILCNGAHPSIMHNKISGGTSGTYDYSVGIYDIGSAATVAYNTIYGGDAYSSSMGISMESGCQAYIYNNIIHGGLTDQGPGTAGVLVDGSSPTLRNNTICAGSILFGASTDGDEGITNLNGASATIENNLIFSLATGQQRKYGVTATSDSLPASFKNNYVFQCPMRPLRA